MRSDGQNPRQLTRAGHSRRQFIERTALASAGALASACTMDRTNSQGTVESASTICDGITTPMHDVEGKVAFVTGGSSGIGLGIARAFAEAGMKVAIGYRSESHLREAMQYLGQGSLGVHGINVDVTDRSGMAAAAAKTVQVFGKVHVVVNNAGVAMLKPVADTSYEDWDWMIGTNLTGVFNGIRAFLPHIQAHGEGGQVITTSSVMGLFTAQGHGTYSASKFGVVGLMEALRLDLLTSNIGVSAFCPGNVWANLGSSLRNHPRAQPDESHRLMDERHKYVAKLKTDHPDLAMDPLEAGRLVLRGMRNNDLYILTHPEFARMIKERHEAVEASNPVDLQAPQRRSEAVQRAYHNPIYVMARDQKLCSRRKA